VIGLSEYAHGHHADAMEKAGAMGVYHKSNASEELYSAKTANAMNPPRLTSI
jgi:hypothetical protein